MNKNSRTLRRKFFQKKIPIYRKNPVLFAQEVLLFEPDDWQKQALMDLAESPKVAIKSGQGVGKTGMEAVALLWFLCCYPYPRIVATAPTKQQLHDVLWSEVSLTTSLVNPYLTYRLFNISLNCSSNIYITPLIKSVFLPLIYFL